MKKVVAILVCVLMLVGLTACAGTPEGDSSNTLKLGLIGPLTGGAAQYGEAVKNGAEIAVEEINALGGLQIELNSQDDEHDQEKSVNAYSNLVDWKAQAIVGCVTSDPCIAVAGYAYSDRMFMLTPSASSPVATEDNDNVFQMCFTDPNQGATVAQYIADKKLAEKIAVIYNNGDSYSTGIRDGFVAKATELGLNVVSKEGFADDSVVDFSTQLSAARDAGADLVFLPIYYGPASKILRQAKDMNYAPTFFGVDGMDGILTVEGFDKSLAKDVLMLTPFSADDPDEKTQAFVKKYKEKHSIAPSQFAADAYDCVYAIYQAITENNVDVKGMSAKDLCEKMIEIFTSEDFKFDGLTGLGQSWSESGEVNKMPKVMLITEVSDGTYGYVEQK